MGVRAAWLLGAAAVVCAAGGPAGPAPDDEVLRLPVKWCVVRGSPAEAHPEWVGARSTDEALQNRHGVAGDRIFLPQARVELVSGAAPPHVHFPVIDDPFPPGAPLAHPLAGRGAPGELGDILSPHAYPLEYERARAACMQAWSGLPSAPGIYAINVNRFVHGDGERAAVSGVGGLGPLSGAPAVIDAAYLDPGSPVYAGLPDPRQAVFGHMVGYALGLLNAPEAGALMHPGRLGRFPSALSASERADLRRSMRDDFGTVDWVSGAPPIRQSALLDPLDDVSNASAEGAVHGRDIVRVVLTEGYLTDHLAVAVETLGEPRSPIEDHEFEYMVAFDIDQDPETGGDPSLVGMPAAAGVEVAIGIRVRERLGSGQYGMRFVDAVGYKLRGSSFVEFEGVSFNPRATRASLLMHGGERIVLSSRDTISLDFPRGHVLGIAVFPFRIEVVSRDPQSGAVDRASGFFDWEPVAYPECELAPNPARPSDRVTASGSGLPPDAAVGLRVGNEEVARGRTDSRGSFTLTFSAEDAAGDGAAARAVAARVEGSALSAECVLGSRSTRR